MSFCPHFAHTCSTSTFFDHSSSPFNHLGTVRIRSATDAGLQSWLVRNEQEQPPTDDKLRGELGAGRKNQPQDHRRSETWNWDDVVLPPGERRGGHGLHFHSSIPLFVPLLSHEHPLCVVPFSCLCPHSYVFTHERLMMYPLLPV